jgi:hypothetical protein
MLVRVVALATLGWDKPGLAWSEVVGRDKKPVAAYQ